MCEAPERPDHLDPRTVEGDEDHGLLAVPRRARVSLAHEDADLGAGVAGAAGPPLAACDSASNML